MTTPPKFAFLGAGNMTTALLRGARTRAGADMARFGASDVRAAALQALQSELGVRTFTSNEEAVRWGDVVVLAIKPQQLAALCAEIAGAVRAEQLIVSIAAGVPIARLCAGLAGHTRVVRAMPNTPALVGAGATAIAYGAVTDEREQGWVRALFESVGTVVDVDEKLLDGVTGVSGSGPAYGFVAIEALADAGVGEGLPRDVALQLAAQALLGAAKMVLETGEHPGQLKDRVASPAGTTIAAIAALEKHGLRAALIAAVEAASARARELGKASGST